jgi:hypothetical protein
MRRPIDLHQLPKAGPPFAQLMDSHLFGFARFPQVFCDHELAYAFIRKFEFLFFH